MSSSTKPSPLGHLLKELLRQKNWQHRFDQHAVFLCWDEVVGPEIASRAQPDCIRGKVLWLRVADSVWMQQLSLQKTTLLAAINQRLGENPLTDIRFRLDLSVEASPEAPPPSEAVRAPVNKEDLRQFDRIAEPLPEGEVKEAMRRLWLRSRGK